MKLYIFRTVLLSIIRSLFTVHSAMVYVIQALYTQLSSRTRMDFAVPSWSCSKAVYKHVWHIPLLSVQWTNSWWWTDELSETCRVSWQNKFVKLVHLVGFITNKSFWCAVCRLKASYMVNLDKESEGCGLCVADKEICSSKWAKCGASYWFCSWTRGQRKPSSCLYMATINWFVLLTATCMSVTLLPFYDHTDYATAPKY